MGAKIPAKTEETSGEEDKTRHMEKTGASRIDEGSNQPGAGRQGGFLVGRGEVVQVQVVNRQIHRIENNPTTQNCATNPIDSQQTVAKVLLVP